MEQTEKLNFLGVGPRIAILAIPTLIVTLILTYCFPHLFKVLVLPFNLQLWIGWVLLISGLVFYGATVKALLKGLRENKLITSGAFRLCQNPLYAALLLFIIPSISFLISSWLIFLTSIIGYIAFKNNIHIEYEQLTRLFGEEYKAYREKTNEFFPWPK